MERKKEYITLPERDALLFESDPSPSLFQVVIPDAVHNYIVRLVTPELQKLAQQGWEVDDDELYPLDPDIKPIVRWVPFTKVKFRCKGVTVHLRRVRIENRSYHSRGDSTSGEAAIRKAFRDAETIRDVLHDRIEKDGEQMQGVNGGTQTLGDLREFARNGLASLCRRMGIPETKTQSIFVSPVVKMWLQEVLLKHAIFSLLLMGKGIELMALRAPLYAGFGEDYVDTITAEAMELYEEFAQVFAQAKQTGDSGLYIQLAAIIRQSITSSSTELEQNHQAYTS